MSDVTASVELSDVELAAVRRAVRCMRDDDYTPVHRCHRALAHLLAAVKAPEPTPPVVAQLVQPTWNEPSGLLPVVEVAQ